MNLRLEHGDAEDMCVYLDPVGAPFGAVRLAAIRTGLDRAEVEDATDFCADVVSSVVTRALRVAGARGAAVAEAAARHARRRRDAAAARLDAKRSRKFNATRTIDDLRETDRLSTRGARPGGKFWE